ncbi:MAG: AmmeMemoRadiSam system protein B [Vicinamibacterales bacterium]
MRRAAGLAGTWYPAEPEQLAGVVDRCLAGDGAAEADGTTPIGLVSPHAGVMYSGPVAGAAYRRLRGQQVEVVFLVGPSHHVAFDGVAVWPRGTFESPLGDCPVHEDLAVMLAARCSFVHERPAAHVPEHCLELQLPFLARVLPGVPIVPLVMGHQTRATAFGLADAMAGIAPPGAVFVASSDLSHFQPRDVASRLDEQVMARVNRFDEDGLMMLLERQPGHACGGGPIVAALAASRAAGATEAHVIQYGDSGDASGDRSSVVGYMAAIASGRTA